MCRGLPPSPLAVTEDIKFIVQLVDLVEPVDAGLAKMTPVRFEEVQNADRRGVEL